MVTTIHLRFETRAAALAALAPIGLVVPDRSTGEQVFVTPAYPGGVRVDIDPIGGDGVYRRQVGTVAQDVSGIVSIEVPVFEAVPGYHVNLLWSGDNPPDFGDAVIDPETPSQVFAA